MKKYKLKDVASVQISNVDKKTQKHETPVRLCNFTDVYYNWAITSSVEDDFLTASANTKEIERFSLQKGQVALTKDSETRYDIGISAYISEDFDDVLLGYHCALITPNESKVNGQYLNAFMHSRYIRKYFENCASGSGQRFSLTIQVLEDIPLLLPSIEEQRYIGQVFSDIDRKITLNRAINHNLEEMIADIMDYRFLSNIKTLPKRLVGEIALIRAGGDCPQVWSKHKTNDCQVPIYSNGTDYEGLYGYTKEPTILKRGITVAARGTIGYCVMREAGYVPIIRLLAVTPNDIGGDVYLHQIFNRLKFRKDGSIQQQLTVPSIASMEIPYPNASALKSFADQTYPIIEEMNQNKAQIEQLTKLRDELLPLLMNGQVSVNYDLSHD